jgi:hypothetical protein
MKHEVYVTSQKIAICRYVAPIYYVILIKHKAVNIKYYDCTHFFASYPSGKMYLKLKILPKALIIK